MERRGELKEIARRGLSWMWMQMAQMGIPVATGSEGRAATTLPQQDKIEGFTDSPAI
jgi:hypothetical protein